MKNILRLCGKADMYYPFKNPIRYKVRVYYGAKSIDVGMFRTLEDALKRRNQYIKDNNISELALKKYNTRNENKD